VPSILILCSFDKLNLQSLTEDKIIPGHFHHFKYDLEFPICQQKNAFFFSKYFSAALHSSVIN